LQRLRGKVWGAMQAIKPRGWRGQADRERRVWAAAAVCAGATLAAAGAVNRAALDGLPPVSVALADAPMSRVLQDLSRQAHCDIRAADPWLASFPVTLRMTNAPVSAALTQLLGNLDYTLELGRREGRVVAITIHAPLPGAGQPPAGAPPGGRPPATARQRLDPAAELLPPPQPGAKGITAREVLAAQAAAASNAAPAAPGRSDRPAAGGR